MWTGSAPHGGVVDHRKVCETWDPNTHGKRHWRHGSPGVHNYWDDYLPPYNNDTGGQCEMVPGLTDKLNKEDIKNMSEYIYNALPEKVSDILYKGNIDEMIQHIKKNYTEEKHKKYFNKIIQIIQTLKDKGIKFEKPNCPPGSTKKNEICERTESD